MGGETVEALNKAARTLTRLVRDVVLVAGGIAGLIGIGAWSGGDLPRAALVFVGFSVAWGFTFVTTSRWLS